MAITRVLNAIWAEISARGSLIKTATNPYNPNPGAGNSGANNQGMAAITGSTPFVKINQDGISADVPVNTSLTGIGSVSPTPLDENSGQYHVTRQYGDIYLYNDGNVISWGGNGKNFSFGNGYEESHAWANQACVYNDEVFAIPLGAMSTFVYSAPLPAGVNLPSADQSQWEWLEIGRASCWVRV